MVVAPVSVVVRAAMVVWLGMALTGCGADEVSAGIERNLVLPDGSHPLTAYARYYADLAPGEWAPFTTMTDASDSVLETRSNLVVGIYHIPDDPEIERPGIHWSSLDGIPIRTHNGCDTVNVLARRDNPAKVLAWCNVDMRMPPPPSPEEPET